MIKEAEQWANAAWANAAPGEVRASLEAAAMQALASIGVSSTGTRALDGSLVSLLRSCADRVVEMDMQAGQAMKVQGALPAGKQRRRRRRS